MAKKKRDPVSDYMAELGRKGAAALNAKLTPEERSRNARRAANANLERIRKAAAK